MRALKAVLYTILSLCILWGLTVTLGPAIIGFALSKSFGEQKIQLTGLKISPKLQISASRAEFDFSDNGRTLYGAVRAPKFNISPTMSGWLIKVSSGLLQVNDAIHLSSFKFDFYTASVTNVNEGRFYFNSPKLAVEEEVEFSDINVSSSLNLSSLELQNLIFSVKKAAITDTQNSDIALLDVVVGRLDEFSLHRDWQSQPLNFDLSVETSEIQSNRFGKIVIQSFLVEAQNDDPVIDAMLMADSLSMEEIGLHLIGIKANPIIDPIALTIAKETRVQIEHGRFERMETNKISGNIKGLEAVVGLHLPARFLKLAGKVNDVEIWNDQFPIFTIPELDLDIEAVISPLAQFQDARVQFKALINGKDGAVVSGKVASKLLNVEGQDCVTENCVASDILLDFKYQFEGEQIVAIGSCPSRQCNDKKSEITVETSNTPKIVMGLTKQKIINPLAMVMFAGTIIQGQEVGLGHKIKF